MEDGFYKMLKRNKLDGPYLKLDDVALKTEESEWNRTFIRRHVHTTDRLMVEVYE